ncbi:MAG: LysE family translocator [Candidatus Sedimenticola sp. (ex Thyasira tokunagai)]
MESSILISVAMFATAMTFSPGPNTILLTTSGAMYGFSKSVNTMMGITCGITLLVLAVGLGLGAIFSANPMFQILIRIAGVIYILWLAIKIVRSNSVLDAKIGQPITFIEAAFFQVVNPKVWMMAIGVHSAFAVTGHDFIKQAFFIAAVFLLVCIPATTVWTVFGVAIRHALRSERAMRLFRIGMAAILIASLVPAILV